MNTLDAGAPTRQSESRDSAAARATTAPPPWRRRLPWVLAVGNTLALVALLLYTWAAIPASTVRIFVMAATAAAMLPAFALRVPWLRFASAIVVLAISTLVLVPVGGELLASDAGAPLVISTIVFEFTLLPLAAMFSLGVGAIVARAATVVAKKRSPWWVTAVAGFVTFCVLLIVVFTAR